ncbi:MULTISPECIES: Qat anti-phage system TatD family nuclease QatD [Paenibacillus]|uniref:TatD DNase family protein n=1 Tax=Paenibacillus pabuli TaxID=1472 RepID=A0A855YEI2_9BACL|nr:MULTISPECIES: Qat anti-phage system TatD family nuclease QatD [Paenibacillus]PWW43427.1 TatD DNase family protein [Paenibacillus pabuli]PXW09334.1 TatD DNase family protein [Paenibacillus taichungensis]
MSNFKFDTHAHLDLYKNSSDVIKYIEENRSYTIAVTNLPILYQKYTKQYQDLKYVRFALGLHPELVFQYKEQIPSMIEYIKDAKYIGEVGLDYVTQDIENRETQREAFRKLVEECDKYGGKLLSIHSRRAVNDVLSILGDSFNGKVILHWFSGSLKELITATELGCYFSINSDMIGSKKGVELIKKMPLDRILIESDAPFTKDTMKNYSLDFVFKIVEAVSQIKGVEFELVNRIFENNFKQLLVKL